MRKVLILALALLGATAPVPRSSQYVFAWATEIGPTAKSAGQDFLAVFNAAPDSADFGKLVAFLPVGKTGTFTHHSNNDLPANGRLFAEDFNSGKWFVFDLRDPLHPKLIARHSNEGQFTHPHSFQQLPNGDTLATFQYTGENKAAGGLVELDPTGNLVRMTRSAGTGVHDFIRPYSMEIVPKLDRIVMSSTDMAPTTPDSHSIQIWRLSDLKLLKTIALPKPQDDGDDVARDTSNARPHWIAKEPLGDRIVLTGYSSMRTHMTFLSLDSATGTLTILPQHIDFDGPWPDGWKGAAVPHSALFSNP